MNRIIILGNGFDLAHRLPTTYQNFVEKYFRSSEENNPFFVRHEKYQHGAKVFDDILNAHIASKKNTPIVRNHIIKFTLEESVTNWFDFEKTYYKYLKNCLGKSGEIDSFISLLNKDFETVKKEFESYILEVINSYQVLSTNAFNEYFYEAFKKQDFSYDISLGHLDFPETVCILNFNYTPTHKRYLDGNLNMSFKSVKSVIDINIHGSISDEKNPIILGYGDELDSDYERIENADHNEFLKHFKSPQYLLTSNYSNLLKFIDSDEYQIYIFGHSCGLTDRTLLNHIFENENCKSIKIFYHKTKEHFLDQVFSISRHFRSKALFRSRLVGFTNSFPCPQL